MGKEIQQLILCLSKFVGIRNHLIDDFEIVFFGCMGRIMGAGIGEPRTQFGHQVVEPGSGSSIDISFFEHV